MGDVTPHELSFTGISKLGAELDLECVPYSPGCEFCEWWSKYGSHELLAKPLNGGGPWEVVPTWEAAHVVLTEDNEGWKCND